MWECDQQQFQNSNITAMLIRPSQCEYLVLQAPLELEKLVDGEVALPVVPEEERDQAGVDALKEGRVSIGNYGKLW